MIYPRRAAALVTLGLFALLDLAVNGDMLYVANGDAGLQILQVAYE